MSEYTIVGAGALGSILCAHLVNDGHEVNVLCRGNRAKQIASQGVVVKGLLDVTVCCELLTQPAELKRCKTLILTMKTYQLREALGSLSHVQVDTVLSVANGISKDEEMAAVFGRDKVMGCVADFSGELDASGEVLYTRNNGFYLGELDGGSSSRLQAIVSDMKKSGLQTSSEDAIESIEWSKFAAWVPVFLLSVLTRELTWKYLSDPACAKIAVDVVYEIGKLASSRGITIADQSLLPAASLLALQEPEVINLVQQVGAEMHRNAPEHKMSSLQDLLKGKPLEVEETLGYLLQLAEQSAVSMPVTQWGYQLASAINRMNTAIR